MEELDPRNVRITDPFWAGRREASSQNGIFHQWQMLEHSGCIDNFRIAAGEKEGFREGWFFADSDATKWLDAAARIERDQHSEPLCALMDDFIALIGRAQEPDGYLFTYNQIHFPGQRWVNLQIEHELYCHGHLIEAGVSHFLATGRQEMLSIACKAADLLVREFSQAEPAMTPGHEEVEIALFRLYAATHEDRYRELARHFIEVRGHTSHFGRSLARQFISNGQRERLIRSQRAGYFAQHPGEQRDRLPAANRAVKPRFSLLRFYGNSLSGRYFQQHLPVREQLVPEGHSVRFGYLETAEAMMLLEYEEEPLFNTMKQVWSHMVHRRMDVTGGLGALPDREGFGRDYELNPEVAYNETCAAIASVLWNWQLALMTNSAKFTDLMEWQLYNAVLPGMGWEGTTYLYNNPTLVRGGIERQPWYSIPCCPSNLSRTFADLGKYVASGASRHIWLHQYMGGTVTLPQTQIDLEIHSQLPWQGKVEVIFHPHRTGEVMFRFRVPSWTESAEYRVNFNSKSYLTYPKFEYEQPLSGVYPEKSYYAIIDREWREGDRLRLEFPTPIQIREPHERAHALRGRVAVTRGPLVYCLESIDQPGVDLFKVRLDRSSLREVFAPDLFGGTLLLKGQSVRGEELTFLPYAQWGNRGKSQMNVWVKG